MDAPAGGCAGVGELNGPELLDCAGPPTALLVVFVIGFCESNVLISFSGFSGFLLNICTFSEVRRGSVLGSMLALCAFQWAFAVFGGLWKLRKRSESQLLPKVP
jgi:hypothetical protein